MTAKAFITGLAGPRLLREERSVLRDELPWGLILFKRNLREAPEIQDLVAGFRDAVGRPDAPVLIDQEGGRVQRLGPPIWPAYPPGAVFGRLAADEPEEGERAAWLGARLIAADLVPLGINVDCLPLLDVISPDVTNAIGDRAYGSRPDLVARLGRAAAEGLLAGGVLPVVKHMPGHGRATVDSHLELPVVDADLDRLDATDFAPFVALADLPVGMSAHIVFRAIDPDRPATLSPTVVGEIIRGRIGFDGLLLTDDISMQALSGSFADRTAAARDAGCDIVLHCNGDLGEMRAVADASVELSGEAARRAAAALARLAVPEPFDPAAGRDELVALTARAGWPAEA